MTAQLPTIFESFNARALTPDQVAASFVPSRQFEDLCKRCHSIVLGPRGSGKTTLLKMLQPAALESWRHPLAEEIASRIDFTGVFVATDISWSQQLSALGHGRLEPETQRLLANASFTTHALRSLVIAFQQRGGSPDAAQARKLKRVQLAGTSQTEVVKEIAGAWHISGIGASLFSLRQALTRRLSAIREIASKEVLLGADGRKDRLASNPDLHLHFLSAAGVAVEAFEHYGGVAAGKWAYLFDELELAPAWVQDELVKSLRSTDDRFLFKLALNPFTSNNHLMQAATSPAAGQDFDQIALWYAEKRDAYSFCQHLWDQLVKGKSLAGLEASSVLGRSYFESAPNDVLETGSAYGPGSRWAKRFAALAAKDQTFADYLARHELAPNNLDIKQGAERASEVRKIAPIVAVRNFYRKNPKDQAAGDAVLRGRKSADLYAGADSVFAITEGNPRWFIGLIGRMLSTLAHDVRRIPPHRQGKELFDAAQRFTATLRTIPVVNSGSSMSISVMQVVRIAGRYFHYETVRGSFRPEPPGSFTVDSKTPEQILQVLTQGLNAGALVYVPDDDGQLILTSLRGKRFRLSYLLAPLYGFPVRLGKDVALSTILRSSDTRTADSENEQLEFSEENDAE
jgi:hypothetical protein